MASTATRNFMLPLPEVELLASMPIVVAAALWVAQNSTNASDPTLGGSFIGRRGAHCLI